MASLRTFCFQRLFPEKGRVAVQIAPQMAGEQRRLEVGEEPYGRLFAEERMDDLLLLSLLIGHQDGFSRCIVHDHASRLAGMEAVGANLLEIDEREGQAVGEEGAQLFHEVERQAGTAGTVAMQEADGRV